MMSHSGDSDSSADAAADSSLQTGERRRSRHRKGTHSQDRKAQRRSRVHRAVWVLLLLTLMAAETSALIVVYSLHSREERDHIRYATALEEGARELEVLRPEVQRLEEEVARLARARLPGLRPVRMDQVIPIGEGHVTNIVFTTSRSDGQVACEYKIVMRNLGSSPVRFRLDILFFNRTGIQIGKARVTANADGTPAPILLDAGETRSFSAVADLDATETTPAYFLLVSRAL
jgi:hypothetical protein